MLSGINNLKEICPLPIEYKVPISSDSFQIFPFSMGLLGLSTVCVNHDIPVCHCYAMSKVCFSTVALTACRLSKF